MSQLPPGSPDHSDKQTADLHPEDAPRAAMIRRLWSDSKAERDRMSPFDSLSLLPLHDAVEMLLTLAAERLGLVAKRDNFGALCDALHAALQAWTPPRALPALVGIRRLNDARVSVKHRGEALAPGHLKPHWRAGDTFLEQLPRLVFGRDLADVSVASFLTSREVRSQIEAAEAALAAGDHRGALEACARGMEVVVPSFDGMQWRPLFDWRPPADMQRERDQRLQELWEEVASLRKQVALLTQGVDPRSHRRFQRLVPFAFRSGGQLRVSQGRSDVGEADVRFCIEFLAETAMSAERAVAREKEE